MIFIRFVKKLKTLFISEKGIDYQEKVKKNTNNLKENESPNEKFINNNNDREKLHNQICKELDKLT